MSCIFKLFETKAQKKKKILRQKEQEFHYEENTCNMIGPLPYDMAELSELEGCLAKRMTYLSLLSTQSLQKTMLLMKAGRSAQAQTYIFFRKEIVEEIKTVGARLLQVQEKIQKQKDGILISIQE